MRSFHDKNNIINILNNLGIELFQKKELGAWTNLSKVVKAMYGHFRAPPLVGPESLVSRLENLVGWFWEAWEGILLPQNLTGFHGSNVSQWREIELKEQSRDYCNAWSDSGFADMVKTTEPFTRELGAALLGCTPPEGSQGGSRPCDGCGRREGVFSLPDTLWNSLHMPMLTVALRSLLCPLGKLEAKAWSVICTSLVNGWIHEAPSIPWPRWAFLTLDFVDPR